MIDLHVHSIYSDGSCTIDEIISQAQNLKLSQIAITDHNNLDGSIIAHNSGKIDSITGTELTTEYENAEIHLLAYFLKESDYKNVKYLLKEAEVKKKIGTVETLENLNAAGIDISLSELSEFTSGIINRVHICKALIKHGYIKTVNEGFEKYVGDHCPAYVRSERIQLMEAVEAIHKDGGIAVIAHPMEYVNDLDVYAFLNAVIDSVEGIECFHPSATPEESAKLVEFTERHKKRITGGSDFHGENKPDIPLGMMKVDDKYRLE